MPPTVCALPPQGEIRFYGEGCYANRGAEGKRVYIATHDGGLSWKYHEVDSDARMGKCIYLDGCGLYIKFVCITDSIKDGHIPALRRETAGTFALLSREGPDSTDYTISKVNNLPLHVFRQAIYLPEKHRILAVSQLDRIPDTTVVFYSDDLGNTWTTRILPHLPKRELTPPDRSIRWQNYSCEPTVVQLEGSKLQIIFRTSYNYHYQYLSQDYGESWDDPTPTDFHGTLTMPLLKRLSSGSLLFLWCNTQPLPKPAPEELPLPLARSEIEGLNEVVFTNRDANHAAISFDNGYTWRGFREMALNPIRNQGDYRTAGLPVEQLDKSMHQFECIELPLGKVLVAYGQNSRCRRLIIFDPKWLLEQHRQEDFLQGCANVSTHTYLVSVPGVTRRFHAHCSWNRTHGPVMMPDPDGNYREALYLSNVRDPRLYSQTQGVVWNYPAMHAGTVCFDAYLDAAGLSVCLTDRWFNPIDSEVATDAPVCFQLSGENTPAGRWVPVRIDFRETGYTVTADGQAITKSPLGSHSVHGLSYLHIQYRSDDQGCYVRNFSANTAE